MPQERLRSVRSFVTCEDPRGVIEGKTIKISISDTTKLGSRREHDTQSKNSKEKEKEKEKEKMSSSKPSSSYELVEVKNGAQKLNEAIDSWSKGGNFKSQPTDIAKDLLKGALDLQESLMMLGKLQEASCMGMAKLKKNQEKSSDVLVGRIKSDRFESFQSYDMGIEKQKKSQNGPSKDCYQELRDVIRDGLSRQNLLPNKSFQKSEEFAGKRKLELSPDMASTSSSRSSSMVYSTHDFTSSESYSSRATEEKSKGSNLIAKLMGLDEFPSRPLPSSPINQLGSSKMRPFIDIDLPNGKKPHFFVQKNDREHMTLDEIINMMQSKGFLRNNKREMKQKRFEDEDDVPPVVLMKPHKVKTNENGNGNMNSVRKRHQEKAKAEEKVMKSREKPGSNKQKSCVIKPERKQEVEKKVDKIQKMAPPVKRKPVEDVKLKKNGSLKSLRNVIAGPVTKRASSTIKSSNQKKNAKIENVVNAVNAVNEPLPTVVHEVSQIETPNEQETEDSEAFFEESCSEINQIETKNNHEEMSVSDIEQRKTTILKTLSTFQDSEPANLVLFKDCVNELLEHENRRKIPWHTTSILTSRNWGSEDDFMREVVKEVEILRNYSNFSNGDMVYGFLERDLCSSKMGGTWSSGWKDGCTLDEVEEAVLDLERMVLSQLIDDVLVELVLCRS